MKLEYATFSNRLLNDGWLDGDGASVPGDWVVQHLSEHPDHPLRLRNLSVSGPIDLTDRRCRAVVLERCVLPEVLDLRHSRLERLSLRGSRISHVDATGCVIRGMADFSGVQPATSCAWLNFDAAQIGGGIRGRGAKLTIPPRRAKEDVEPWQRNYALRLSGANVRGGVDLNGEFVADGGVTIEGASIKGTISLRGARLSRSEDDPFHSGDCFNASSANVDGGLFITFGVHTEGRLVLIGTRIAGTVSLGMLDSHFAMTAINSTWLKGQKSARNVIVLDNATIGGELYLIGATADAGISLRSASIGGNLQMAGITIGAREEHRPPVAIDAGGARIAGGVFAGAGLHVHGALNLEDAQIGGRADLSGLGGEGVDGLETARVGTRTIIRKSSET